MVDIALIRVRRTAAGISSGPLKCGALVAPHASPHAFIVASTRMINKLSGARLAHDTGEHLTD